jgi:hypothetical protein
MASEKLYLYMARRDKSGMRVLAILQGAAKTSRIHDLSTLNLPQNMHEAISQEVDANRLLWEVWIEPAESFNKLKEALHKRGFKSLPISSKPIMPSQRNKAIDTTALTETKRKGMLQRGGK